MNHTRNAVGAVLYLVFLPVLIIYDGVALLLMWKWFVCPTFGAPHLALPAAIGISTIFGLLCPTPSPKDDSDPLKQFGTSAAKISLFLFIGWLVHFWM